MRTKPIGTGPSSSSSSIRTRSSGSPESRLWRQGRPYLDEVEFEHRREPLDAHPWRSWRMIRLLLGDITVPLSGTSWRVRHRDCQLATDRRQHQADREPQPAPFDNAAAAQGHAPWPRPAELHQHCEQQQSDLSGGMMPQPEGVWGMPKEMLMALPGSGHLQTNGSAEARKLMERLGYGPDKRLKVKVRRAISRPSRTQPSCLSTSSTRCTSRPSSRSSSRRSGSAVSTAGLRRRPQSVGLGRR